METNEIREELLNILQGIHEDVDFEANDRLVDDKILDSFNLVSLASEISDDFDVDIKAKDFVAENFNSVDALTALIEKRMDE